MSTAGPSRGAIIAGYKLEFPIGRGGSGTVWRAAHPGDGAPVAIKVMRTRDEDSHVLRLRREREAMAAAMVAGAPGVVHTVCSGSNPVEHIVMEYVDGVDLRWMLSARGRLPVADTIRIALDVAQALIGVHRAGVVHRDIKPANILIAREGRARLADFGAAQIGPPPTHPAGVPLTMAYAAPEVWLGRAEPRSDIYAFGAVMYESLTGTPPFGGPVASLRRQHEQAAPAFARVPASVPRSVVQLVRACLEKDTSLRPANAQDCVDVLARAEASQRRVESGGATECVAGRRKVGTRSARSGRSRRQPRWSDCIGRKNGGDANATLTLEQFAICA